MDIFKRLKGLSSPALTGAVEFLIVGLGNPGAQYENTRHNAGFMAADMLAGKHNIKINRLKFKSLCGDAVISSKKCLIMKPQTYMNNSGQAIVEAMRFYKIPIENILVIYDDISLEPSQLRIRRKGTDGGHNGIKSIIYLTGKDTFPRIKIGVGKKPHPQYNLADWVLSSFKKDEEKPLTEALEKVAFAVELIISGKTDEAMNKFNS
ncbi:MAG: aminoacyl-tRNA hydrolase [Oscillospiraceae bacterium]|jgi:PTH1 family peptidyl-tRNA hydrolase